jgi:hypothetical protein
MSESLPARVKLQASLGQFMGSVHSKIGHHSGQAGDSESDPESRMPTL